MQSEKTTTVADLVLGAARSGTPLYLRIGNGTPVAEVWIDGGKLTGAVAVGSDRRVGARLVATGHLRAAELGKLETRASTEQMSLHRLLAGKVRRDVLEQVARDEARFALATALDAPLDQIESDASSAPPGAAPLSLDAEELLQEAEVFLKAARAAEEVVTAGSVLVIGESPGPGEILAPEESAVLALADGMTPVGRIAEMCGFPEAEALILAERLVRNGFAVVDEASGAAALLAELEAAQDLAAMSAAFETTTDAEPELFIAQPEPVFEDAPELIVIEPEPEPEPLAVAEPEPIAITEPEPELPAPEPAPTARADFSALLRELSSIARRDEPGR